MASEKHGAESPSVAAVPNGSQDELSEDLMRNHTEHDRRDMLRMGKKQELVRNFRILSSIAFTSCVMGTWEIMLTSNTSALIAGGISGLWWQFIWCYVGQTAVVISLCEMSSMAPTAALTPGVGGQYHWVSEFAPPSVQKILSYTSGWLSTTAWQAFIAVDSYICAALIQSMITLNDPSYTWPRWHTTLLMIAIVIGMGLFNIFLAQWLAVIEGFFAVLHYVSWIAVVAVLWAMTPEKNSAKEVFTSFTDNGAGWSSIGLTVCIGQVGAAFTVVGSDASVHVGEETSNAGIVVPRSMWWSYVLNVLPTLITLATYCFCLGPDLESVLGAETGFPITNVFLYSTGSTSAATGLTALMFILLLIISTSCMVSTSRATFAFARDNGMVGSKWIAKVSQRQKVPANSLIVTMGFTIVMALINLGSTTAFNAFLSVSVVALMATYTISIACVLVRRLGNEPLPPVRWKLFSRNSPASGHRNGGLGKLGVPINVFAMIYSVWTFFWSFWPIGAHPTAETMNWAVLIFGAIMLLAALAFVVHARKVYDGPVAKVRKLEDENVEGDTRQTLGESF